MKSESERNFFGPLWRRLVLVALVGAWFAYEALVIQDQLWLLIVGAMFAYTIWTYLIRWDSTPPPPPPAT